MIEPTIQENVVIGKRVVVSLKNSSDTLQKGTLVVTVGGVERPCKLDDEGPAVAHEVTVPAKAAFTFDVTDWSKDGDAGLAFAVAVTVDDQARQHSRTIRAEAT